MDSMEIQDMRKKDVVVDGLELGELSMQYTGLLDDNTGGVVWTATDAGHPDQERVGDCVDKVSRARKAAQAVNRKYESLGDTFSSKRRCLLTGGCRYPEDPDVLGRDEVLRLVCRSCRRDVEDVLMTSRAAQGLAGLYGRELAEAAALRTPASDIPTDVDPAEFYRIEAGVVRGADLRLGGERVMWGESEPKPDEKPFFLRLYYSKADVYERENGEKFSGSMDPPWGIEYHGAYWDCLGIGRRSDTLVDECGERYMPGADYLSVMPVPDKAGRTKFVSPTSKASFAMDKAVTQALGRDEADPLMRGSFKSRLSGWSFGQPMFSVGTAYFKTKDEAKAATAEEALRLLCRDKPFDVQRELARYDKFLALWAEFQKAADALESRKFDMSEIPKGIGVAAFLMNQKEDAGMARVFGYGSEPPALALEVDCTRGFVGHNSPYRWKVCSREAIEAAIEDGKLHGRGSSVSEADYRRAIDFAGDVCPFCGRHVDTCGPLGAWSLMDLASPGRRSSWREKEPWDVRAMCVHCADRILRYGQEHWEEMSHAVSDLSYGEKDRQKAAFEAKLRGLCLSPEELGAQGDSDIRDRFPWELVWLDMEGAVEKAVRADLAVFGDRGFGRKLEPWEWTGPDPYAGLESLNMAIRSKMRPVDKFVSVWDGEIGPCSASCEEIFYLVKKYALLHAGRIREAMAWCIENRKLAVEYACRFRKWAEAYGMRLNGDFIEEHYIDVPLISYYGVRIQDGGHVATVACSVDRLAEIVGMKVAPVPGAMVRPQPWALMDWEYAI